MSTFTRFSAQEQLVYNKSLSLLAGKDIWNTVPGFRYYIGHEGSGEYVDVESGFATDGGTIPRIAWSIIPVVGEYSQCFSLHDKLCTTYYIIVENENGIRKVPITRKRIDEILKESMDVMEVTPWKKHVIMTFVTLYRWIKNPTEPKPVFKPV